MGAIRKTFSVLTFGLIDFRSEKERNARYSPLQQEVGHGSNQADPCLCSR
jgi:hypothetical protein